MPPQSTTYTFPLNSASIGAGIYSPQAWDNMSGREVTLFQNKQMAYCIYALSVLWSIVIIVTDSLQLLQSSQHDGMTNATLAGEIMINADGMHAWIGAVIITMLVMDIGVLVTQFVDLVWFHFTLWPLTALTWFGQLNGTGLASALLSAYLFYPHADGFERDYKLALAMFSLAAHALFISSQFAVTLEFLVRSVSVGKVE